MMIDHALGKCVLLIFPLVRGACGDQDHSWLRHDRCVFSDADLVAFVRARAFRGTNKYDAQRG